MAVRKRRRLCAYCGQSTNDWTDDHVVCDCLWDDRPLPVQMSTVPSCFRCNNFFSRYEGKFRTMLTMLYETGDHPLVQQMAAGVVQRHFQKDDAFRREIYGSVRIEPHVNDLGLFTGMKPTFKFDWNVWETVIGKIVRGTYYIERQQPMPLTYAVQSWRGNGFWTDPDVIAMIAQLPDEWAGMGLNDDVFAGKRGYSVKEPDRMIVLMSFFQSVGVFAWTVPLDEAQLADPSHPEAVRTTIARHEKDKAAKKARHKG